MPVQIAGSGTITGLLSLSLPLTGLLKGTGAGNNIAVAVSGTDYAPATTGTAIFYGNGSGGFSNVTIGAKLTFVGGVLDAVGGGTVTTLSVVSANGFAGTVANPTTTPAITLTTNLTGLLKGNGTAMSAAVAGTDYVTPTGTETLTNKTLTNPTITNYTETVNAPAAGSSFTVALTTGTIQKLTTNANTTITLPASVAGKNYSIIVAYGGVHTITWAGGGVLKWAGGTAPTATSVSGKFDIFVFTCDGANTYGRSGGSNF
jgi:hypothetical protein